MICLIVAGFLLVASAAPSAAAEQGELDASPALFSVLAAINAAGYDADIDSPSNHPVRQRVRKALASRDIPSLQDLKRFFREHRRSDWTAELSQYISFALVVDGPPDFNYRLRRNELPPDVSPLHELPELMARFHREAGIDELWNLAQPDIDAVIERYHEPVTRAVMEVNGYLRFVSGSYLGRRFQIYVDLLGAPNQIHSRSYGDDYFVVLTASAEPQVEDVRHAYLHYLLDPMVMRFSNELEEKKALGDYALGAPFLEDYYKHDFLLLATESLIKAVESRLARGEARRQELIRQALEEGFILAPHFGEQLPAYEAQEQAMRFHMPELLKSIDLRREERRLDRYEFPTERRVRQAKVVPAEQPAALSGPQRTAEEAERFYADRELEKAREAYLRLLTETPDKNLHAKAYFGLARIAALENDPETAFQLFQRTLEAGPDPQTRAWSFVYLGRLADIAGEREEAGRYYRAALAVDGASDAARTAAEGGLQKSFGRDK